MPTAMILADIRFPLERANGVQIVKTAAALARTGLPTTLLLRRSDPRPTEAILSLYGESPNPNLRIERLRVFHRRGSFALPRASFLGGAVLRSALKPGRNCVLLTRDLQLADWLLRLGVRPLVYEAHAVEALMYKERGTLYGTAEVEDPRKTARLEQRERRVWKGTDAFVSTTAGISETFTERYGPRERTYVVPNGCDVPGEFLPPSPKTPARVLYAGQLYPWKGVDVLVRAMTRVPAARLVIAGGLDGEPDLKRVRDLVSSLGLEGRTEMMGTIPHAQVAGEMARASVVVVPFLSTLMTQRHTSPIKAFEAMAAGRPLVVSDLPSSREFLRDNHTALLVAPGEPEILAAAIRRLLEDPTLALRLAEAAFHDARRYTWDERGRALQRLLLEVG